MIWKSFAKLHARTPGIRTLVGYRLAGMGIPDKVPATLALSVLVFSCTPFLVSALLRIPAAPWSEWPRASLMSAQVATNMALALDGSVAAVALCAGILGIARFLAKGDQVALLVGVAMLLYAPMEALPALVEASSLSGNGAPSIGIGARVFLAVLLVGGSAALGTKRESDSADSAGRLGIGISLAVSIAFGILFSWTLIPLLGFLIGGCFIFPRLHRRRPSLLSLALLLAAVPHIVFEVETNFLVSETTRIDFWIAHSQKFFAAGILFLGLALDYFRAEQQEETLTRDLRSLTETMTDQQKEVETARIELDRGERARHILEQAAGAISLGLTIIDMEGKILYVNKADADMHGYEPSELLGQSARLYAGTDSETVEPRPPILRTWRRESINTRRNGSRFPVRLISEPILDRDGSPIGLLTVCEDISEKNAAERLKEDFLATVSHELRTPLTAIIASLNLLDLKGLDKERIPKLLDMAKRNSERLLRLISDLLDLQKLRAGKMTFRISQVDAFEAVESVLAEMGVLAEARGVTIELPKRLEGMQVLADPQHLHQVVANLLSNAVKFSPHGKSARVHVSVKRERRGVRISVSDQGPGIPENRLDSLLEPFARIESTSEAAQSGTGLGLAIVKRLLDGMNGSITFDSMVGVGTTVRILLPRAKKPKPL